MTTEECTFPRIDYDLPMPQDNDDLNDEITRLAGHINAATYRFLKLLAEQIRRGAWSAGGEIKSPAHWLNYRCGITIGAAREKVRVAACLDSLPLIDNAFKSGALSYSKVRAMVRVATPENEHFLLQIARYGTASHMEKLVRKHQWVERLNGEDQAATQQEARSFSWFYDEDGMVIFHGKLPADSGAVVVKALQAAFDAANNRSTGPDKVAERLSKEFPLAERETFQEDQDEDEEWSVVYECTADEGDEHMVDPEAVVADAAFAVPDDVVPEPTPRRHEDDLDREIESDAVLESSNPRNDSAETFTHIDSMDSYEQLRADALVLMSEHLLATGDEGISCLAGGDKVQIMIHIDANSIDGGKTLNGEGDKTHCYLDGGPFLCPDTVRRLACDAGIVTVLEDSDGNILNVGRKSRVVPSPVRRALNLRDQGCVFPSCTESRYAEVHHIEHWCDGGETSLTNLILLCHHHHVLLHEGKYRVFVDDDQQLVFVNLLNERIKAALYPQFPDQEDDTQLPLVIERDNEALGLAIDEATCGTQWLGERMDYDEAVCVLQESRH